MTYPKLIKAESFQLGLEYPQKSIERWQFGKKDFEIKVTKGKYLDFTQLKSFDKNKFKKKVKKFYQIRSGCFKNFNNLEEVKKCYFCQMPVDENKFKIIAKIYGAKYIQCPKCSHIFILKRANEKFLKKFYTENKDYASTYTSKKSLKIRINQVVEPKIEWMREVYYKNYNRKPKNILDVGAGGGHFVFACKQKGYQAEGIEISEESCKFAKEKFRIDLKKQDFSKIYFEKKYDIITFWGVIEHLPNPRQFIKKAMSLLTPQGMIIIQGPNFYSLSTAIQKNFSNSVIRHLDPLSHIQIFTEKSLVYLLFDFGLTPKAIWYFGMDVYELFSQLSNLNYSVIPKLNLFMNEIQKIVDLGKISDSIIVAATN
jgi:2-polyprenyl-3-methyl-5-hydroxy-6-metoxy-1,4-benzoquinol methylase